MRKKAAAREFREVESLGRKHQMLCPHTHPYPINGHADLT